MGKLYIGWWDCRETTPTELKTIAEPILRRMGGAFLEKSSGEKPIAYFHYGEESPLTFEFASSIDRQKAMDAVKYAINGLKISDLGTSGYFIAPRHYSL